MNAIPKELRRVAEATGKATNEITVVVLNRDRNNDLVASLRKGPRSVVLIPHGDTAPAIAVAHLTATSTW